MSVRILTEAQYKMLCSARKHGNAFWHVRTETAPLVAAYRTRDGLIAKGWLKFGDVYVEITDAGREALARFEGAQAGRLS